MFGVNQAECCDGETASAAPLRTSEIAAVRSEGRTPEHSEQPAPPSGKPRRG